MIKVLVFGTFDIFHEGHRSFLQQARRHGDFLRVVVARDKNVLETKGKTALFSEEERIGEIVKSGLADDVVLGGLDDRFEVVREYEPDVICMGYDQNPSDFELRKKLDELGLEKTKIIRLNAFEPEKYKSSILREQMK